MSAEFYGGWEAFVALGAHVCTEVLGHGVYYYNSWYYGMGGDIEKLLMDGWEQGD